MDSFQALKSPFTQHTQAFATMQRILGNREATSTTWGHDTAPGRWEYGDRGKPPYPTPDGCIDVSDAIDIGNKEAQ
jgi:hypothetical protein